MAIPYMFRRPETITQQSFAQEADRAAPMAILPYAQALGSIKSAPITGPGDTTYLRQLKSGGDMRNALSAGLASDLGNIRTREIGQVLEAQRGQQARRLQDEQLASRRYSQIAGQAGESLGQIPGGIASGLMELDAYLLESTGQGLADVMKAQAQRDQVSSQALGQRLNEQAMPSAPAPQAGVGLDQLQDAWNPDVEASAQANAELQDIARRGMDYEQSRGSTEQIQSFLQSDNPHVRQAGMTMLDAAEKALAEEAMFKEAIFKDAGVQSTAIEDAFYEAIQSGDYRRAQELRDLLKNPVDHRGRTLEELSR
mgnify:CR=1 FL=1